MSERKCLIILFMVVFHCACAKSFIETESRGYELKLKPNQPAVEPFRVLVDDAIRSLDEVVREMKKFSLHKGDVDKRNFGSGRVHGYLAKTRGRNGPDVNAWNKNFHSLFGR